MLSSILCNAYTQQWNRFFCREVEIFILLWFTCCRAARSVEPLLRRLRDWNRCATSRIKSQLFSCPLLKIQEVRVTYSRSRVYISGFAKVWALCLRNDRVCPSTFLGDRRFPSYICAGCLLLYAPKKYLRFLRLFFFICRCRFLGTHCIRAERWTRLRPSQIASCCCFSLAFNGISRPSCAVFLACEWLEKSLRRTLRNWYECRGRRSDFGGYVIFSYVSASRLRSRHACTWGSMLKKKKSILQVSVHVVKNPARDLN